MQYGNCLYCNLVGILNKNKNPDGLVWTIFGGHNPKVGVNHVKLVVSLYYYDVMVYSFCLHHDDDYECSPNVLIGVKTTKFFYFCRLLECLIALR